MHTCTERYICIWDNSSILLNVDLPSWCTINTYECNQSKSVHTCYRLIDGIYLVSHTCTLAVTWVSVWAKERDYPRNVCVTGKHLCQTSCFKFFWGVWMAQRLIWAWPPLVCVTSALEGEFPCYVSAFVLYLILLRPLAKCQLLLLLCSIASIPAPPCPCISAVSLASSNQL